jgi:hypothetical protein
MTNFFGQRSIFLMTTFFVFCENNGMNSLMPYEFCGKKIKRCSFLEKIPMSEANDTYLPNDMYFEIGARVLGTDACNDILESWMHKYSVNEYINFICLASKFAEKMKCDVFDLLSIIYERGENNFFKWIEDITVEEIAEKVNNNTVITIIEYALLNSIPVKKGALPINKKEVWVKRALIEKCYIAKYELVKLHGVINSINILESSIFLATRFHTLQKSKETFFSVYPLQFIFGVVCLAMNNNSPILKPYDPKIID